MQESPHSISYSIIVELFDRRSGTRIATFHLVRRGADSTAVALAHQLWAAALGGYSPRIVIQEKSQDDRTTDPLEAVPPTH